MSPAITDSGSEESNSLNEDDFSISFYFFLTVVSLSNNYSRNITANIRNLLSSLNIRNETR